MEVLWLVCRPVPVGLHPGMDILSAGHQEKIFEVDLQPASGCVLENSGDVFSGAVTHISF
jgi:hypothetical protein